jgi:ribosomal protein S18 acetylase RimI-like enzyme
MKMRAPWKVLPPRRGAPTCGIGGGVIVSRQGLLYRSGAFIPRHHDGSSLFSTASQPKGFEPQLHLASYPALAIRQASARDIPHIKFRNEESLPENYTFDYYENHLRCWPELSLVCDSGSNSVVAYALGRAVVVGPAFLYGEEVYQGHVHSIAVSPLFRGRNIAIDMMEELHSRMITVYGVRTITLHCRVRNVCLWLCLLCLISSPLMMFMLGLQCGGPGFV